MPDRLKVSCPHMGTYTDLITREFSESFGWEVTVINPSQSGIELGARYMNELMCLPAKVTLGGFIEAAQKGVRDFLMFDSCLTDNNDVWTRRGLIKPSNIQVGDRLLSLNEDTHEIGWTEVKRIFRRSACEVVKIKMAVGAELKVLEVTPGHPVYVKRNNQWQWSKAGELVIGDTLYTAKGWARKVPMTGDSNPYRRYPHLRIRQAERMKVNNPLFNPDVRLKHLLSAGSAEVRAKKSIGNKGLNTGENNGLRKHPEKNPMHNILNRERVSRGLKAAGVSPLNHYTREEWGRKMSAALRRDPQRLKKFQEAGTKGIKARPDLLHKLARSGQVAQNRLHPNHVEQAYMDSDLPIRYIGNWKMCIGGLYPDFIVEGQRKLIEVRHPIWCDISGITWEQYCSGRSAVFKQEGYETLFINEAVTPVEEGIRLIRDFINNGRKVIQIEREVQNTTVYNYFCMPNNNYYVNGVLTHNCGDCRLKSYWILQQRALKKLGYDATVYPVRLGKATPGDIRRADPSISYWKAWRVFLKTLGKIRRLDRELWHKPGKNGAIRIGLVGEIFSILEPAVNRDLIKKLEKLGVEVHNSLPLSYFLFKEFYNRGWMERDGMDRRTFLKARALADDYFPKESIGGHGKESIIHTIYYALKGFDGVIHVLPFPCAPESTVAPIIEDIGRDYSVNVMRLTFDTHTAEAGLMTRLEAFTDMLKRKGGQR